MGLLSRTPAPVEPSAIERAAQTGVVRHCVACQSVGHPTVTVQLPGYGPTWVCADPAACRVRATTAGIYCTVGGAA